MSSDLLEAFGTSSNQPQSTTAQQVSSHTPAYSNTAFGVLQPSSGPSQQPHNPWASDPPPEEEDDFGDFEDAPQAPSAPLPTTNASHTLAHGFPAATPFTQQVPQKGNLLGESFVDDGPSPNEQISSPWDQPVQQSLASPWSPAPSQEFQQTFRESRHAVNVQAKLDKIAPNPDVLFDAGMVEDDDFGDFEDSAEQEQTVSVPSAVGHTDDLLGLDSELQTLNFGATGQQVPKSAQQDLLDTVSFAPEPSLQDNVTTAKTAKPQPKKTPKPKIQKATSVKPAVEDDSAWDEFADWEPTTPRTAADKDKDSPVTQITSSIKSSITSNPQADGLPPTNVPPPAMVLSLFPLIFADAQAKLFKPLAAQPFLLKNRLLSDSTVAEFLKGYLLLAIVAARVIAGRKLRWKRDAHLSQGMRIGAASSRSTSGMKLTSVDKSESVKEDREALDVVQGWREQLGRLRSAVAGANSVNASASLGPVPELQETMPVRTAKDSEGGLTSPQPCALCGLKRNERIAKIENDVDDSFGEWWVEKSSMHRACRNFWQQHQQTLRQR